MNTGSEKYLSRYAEQEARNIDLELFSVCDAVLVIPAYKERPDFIRNLLESRFKAITRLQVIIVSNHPKQLSDSDRQEALKCHQDLFRTLPTPSWECENLSYHRSGGVDFLFVDKTAQRALNVKDGVGLARKIGADLALRLIDESKIRIPWIFNTDSDAKLDHDHFSASENITGSTTALVYPFKHIIINQSDTEETPLKLVKATQLYEVSLNHYKNGLSKAGSRYAYHSVGSTIAVCPKAYFQSRGFPPRAAGEDFYLLNKLAKLGEIESLASPLVHLNVRHSDRVPFGTGPAVAKILENSNYLDTALFYHPRIFELLAVFLRTMQNSDRLSLLEDAPEELKLAIDYVNIDQFYSHALKQNLSEEQYLEQLHVWFDAFKTLKFVHFLRDNYWPNLNLSELNNLEKASKN